MAGLYDVKSLTRDEQNALFLAAKNGDARAREKLVMSMHGLVRHLAKTIWRMGGEVLDELVQAGHLGLLEAVERFDPNREVKISSYASFWVLMRMRQAKQRVLGAQSEPARWNPAEDRARKLVAEGMTDPDELSRRSGMTRFGALRLLQMMSGSDVPLDAPRGTDGDVSLHDIFVGVDPETEIVASDEARAARARIQEALALLSPREQEIVRLRWLQPDEDDCQTLADVGQKLGLSRERVRQIEEDLFKKMRSGLGAHRAGKQTPVRERGETRRPVKRRRAAPAAPPPGSITLEVAAARLGISQKAALDLAADGDLPVTSVAGQPVVSVAALAPLLRARGRPQYDLALPEGLAVQIDSSRALTARDVDVLRRRLLWLTDAGDTEAGPPGWIPAGILAARLGVRPRWVAQHASDFPSVRVGRLQLFDPGPCMAARRARGEPTYHVRLGRGATAKLHTSRELTEADVDLVHDALLALV